jgi:FMN phosphatase YigB (HAD superfamily)
VAWAKHQVLWHQRIAFTGVDMTRLTLSTLRVTLANEREQALIAELEEEILDHDVRALEGGRETLLALAQAGVRRALICDTGYTPGRVVRQLLAKVGLLDLLEVQIFSNEIGAPKPDARPFQAALQALGVPAEGAVHVGDLRRSDIAGAKNMAMGSVRLRAMNDDSDQGSGAGAGVIDCTAAACQPICVRPEADAVADSHRHLLQILGFA